MFILKEVYEEGTIPEYKQSNSIKKEIIMQNKAKSEVKFISCNLIFTQNPLKKVQGSPGNKLN